jgi:hypothetical protein
MVTTPHPQFRFLIALAGTLRKGGFIVGATVWIEFARADGAEILIVSIQIGNHVPCMHGAWIPAATKALCEPFKLLWRQPVTLPAFFVNDDAFVRPSAVGSNVEQEPGNRPVDAGLGCLGRNPFSAHTLARIARPKASD